MTFGTNLHSIANLAVQRRLMCDKECKKKLPGLLVDKDG